MILDHNSISIGDITKQNCLLVKQPPCTCNIFAKPVFTTFFKLLAFPQFLRYNGEIDMIYHAWMEYDSRRWDERLGFLRATSHTNRLTNLIFGTESL